MSPLVSATTRQSQQASLLNVHIEVYLPALVCLIK